ncbi:hypothetical protein QJS04_geneDACA020423 [Acorus gramineus]|uniref:Uncharacterized protein n=1 Tax=Acorus gramineus TaxID=55184 RepID=A0AAV9BS98_ACOGR|nr:hypothetical protein QJS04_geneDACA020423 [Acorus gramineus]
MGPGGSGRGCGLKRRRSCVGQPPTFSNESVGVIGSHGGDVSDSLVYGGGGGGGSIGAAESVAQNPSVSLFSSGDGLSPFMQKRGRELELLMRTINESN